MSVNSNVRNVAIILVLAAVVAFAPGGGSGANVLIEAISLGFLAAIGWIGSLMYRQHRTALYALGDGRRAALYGAMVVLALTLTATARLTSTSGGSVAWLLLVGASVYVGGTVIWSARKY
jgi:hypothetical protein